MTLSILGMEYVNIHGCPLSCILFRKQYAIAIYVFNVDRVDGKLVKMKMLLIFHLKNYGSSFLFHVSKKCSIVLDS